MLSDEIAETTWAAQRNQLKTNKNRANDAVILA